MKKTLSILFSFLLFLTTALSTLAENYQPVISDEAFSLALQEDRLALIPSEIVLSFQKDDVIRELERFNQAISLLDDEENQISVSDLITLDVEIYTSKDNFRDSFKYFTLSPDGTKVFAVNRRYIPFIYDINTGHLRFLAPKEEMGRDGYHRVYKDAQLIEDQSVLWSPDGKYIALCFPKKVLAYAQLGANIILIDTEAGTVVQLDKNLPIKPKYREYSFGYPIRPVFSSEEPLLYYEVYSVEMPYRHNQIRSFNLQTGDIKTVSIFTNISNIDSQLWQTPLGIMNTVISADLEGPRGVSIHGPGAISTSTLRDPEDPFQLNLTSLLIDYAQGRGVLFSSQRGAKGSSSIIQLFELDDLAGSIFSRGLAVDPNASPNQRLIQLELDEIYTTTMFIPPSLYSGHEIPGNAALSPSGDYLLLVVTGSSEKLSMYIYDFNSEKLGRVNLPETPNDYRVPFAAFQEGYNNTARGIKWLEGNRILATLGGQNRVYDLVVTSKPAMIQTLCDIFGM